ncbi:cytochrome P450 [Micromonospora tarensis]|uniref:Cytochrome P450 n=1 Tax=Micromonospora tarensis TaxID=2806100 RepID=A0ABS1YA89_9ACTN|nr:cytochrome P450 [Micromonospora tarensis]MBM0274292.1 cytochrome P450 [Micromonospora tarensis]
MTATAEASPVTPIDIFDPMSPATLKDPYPAYARLRDRCPVGLLEPLDMWVVGRHPDVRSILSAPDSFSAALAFGKDSSLSDPRDPTPRRLNLRFAGDSGGVVSSSDGSEHVRLRRMVARNLAKPQLDALDATVGDQVRRVVAQLAGRGPRFDVVNDLAKPVAVKAIGRVMGLSDEVADTLAAWVDLTFRSLDPGDELSTAAAEKPLMRSNLASFRAVTSFLGRAAADPSIRSNSLVETWRQADTPKAREEVILAVLQLFQAGYETIVSALGYFVDRFLVDQSSSLLHRTASDRLADVIDEGMRLASPVRATFRVAVGDQIVDRTRIPDGAMVMVLIASANRDDRVYSDPDEARLGRPTTSLAFGAGPHRCLGRALAHLELRHVLTTLLASTKSLSADGAAQTSANILKASYEHLPVRAEWR